MARLQERLRIRRPFFGHREGKGAKSVCLHLSLLPRQHAVRSGRREPKKFARTTMQHEFEPIEPNKIVLGDDVIFHKAKVAVELGVLVGSRFYQLIVSDHEIEFVFQPCPNPWLDELREYGFPVLQGAVCAGLKRNSERNVFFHVCVHTLVAEQEAVQVRG